MDVAVRATASASAVAAAKAVGTARETAVEIATILDDTAESVAQLAGLVGDTAARGVLRLQAVARGKRTRKAWEYLRSHDNKMSRWAFWPLFFFFLAAKVELALCLLAAATDQLTQYGVAPPTSATAQFTTPFQKHPHNWGTLYQLSVVGHIITGSLLLVSMWVPMFTEKGAKVHRMFGRLFALAWVAHMLDGLFNASRVIITRGYHEELYPQPDEGFSLWLYVQFGFVANSVCDFMMCGLLVLQFKTGAPSWVRSLMSVVCWSSIAYTACMVLTGIHNVLPATSPSDTAFEYGIIFLVDFPPYAYLAYKNLRWWRRDDPTYSLWGWPVEHQRNLLFVANFTLITGVANLTFKVAPWLTVALFASQEVTWWVWVYFKEKEMKRALRRIFVSSRAREKRAAALNSELAARAKANGVVTMGVGGKNPLVRRNSAVSAGAGAAATSVEASSVADTAIVSMAGAGVGSGTVRASRTDSAAGTGAAPSGAASAAASVTDDHEAPTPPNASGGTDSKPAEEELVTSAFI